MRKCYLCKTRIPLGEVAHPYPLDELDKEILNLKETRMLLYFHEGCFLGWLKHHIYYRRRGREKV